MDCKFTQRLGEAQKELNSPSIKKSLGKLLSNVQVSVTKSMEHGRVSSVATFYDGDVIFGQRVVVGGVTTTCLEIPLIDTDDDRLYDCEYIDTAFDLAFEDKLGIAARLFVRAALLEAAEMDHEAA